MIERLIIDGNGMAVRQFKSAEAKLVASGPLAEDKESLPAVVAYQMVELVIRLVQQFSPRNLVICWDTRGSWARRQAIFPAYKKNRIEAAPTPEQVVAKGHLRRQLRDAQLLLHLLGVDQAQGVGYEADDLVAWYAYRTEPHQRAVVVARDKDAFQLVSANVCAYNPFEQVLVTDRSFRQEVGIAADRFVEYLSMVGDKSDGVPGVPLVGKKTARSWLAQAMTAEEIAATVTKPKTAAANLRERLDDVRRNRMLVDLRWVRTVADIPRRPGEWRPADARYIAARLMMGKLLDRWGTVESTLGALAALRHGMVVA